MRAVTQPRSGQVPVRVRATLAHAAVQDIADERGLHVLHVKGAALDPELRAPRRGFGDADVLVRPTHVPAMLEALLHHDWRLVNSFPYASSFEHSATLRHSEWGVVDLHRWFPGLGGDPEEAFEKLWTRRETKLIAGIPCQVPDLVSQALLLLLHAARSGGSVKARADVAKVWDSASPQLREGILEAVARHHAEVGFSVILGRLDDYADRPDYELWRVASRGGTRLEEWRARFRAAPGWREKTALVLRAPRVNREHLEIVRGRPMTFREVATEFFLRPVRGLRQELQRVVARVPNRRNRR